MYCVYLTAYKGNKLPPFYIGSSSVERVNSGYRGTVTSKKYKLIWKSELKDNPHLFETKIICSYSTRQEALDKECKLQVALNILDKDTNKMYINQAVASVNGFFGMNKIGIKHKTSTKLQMSISHTGKKESEETKRKKSEALTGITRTDHTKELISLANSGKIRSEETKEKISLSITGDKNPRYGYKFTQEEIENHSNMIKNYIL